MATHRRTLRYAWWLALLSGSLVSLAGTCLGDDDAAAQEAAIRAAQPDPTVAALLRKVEQQVTEGHSMAPPEDNAVETWQQVINKIPHPESAGFARALADFIADVNKQTVADLAAKDRVAANDLLMFKDLAASELQYFHPPVASEATSSQAAMQPAPQQASVSPAHAPQFDPKPVQTDPQRAIAASAAQPPDHSGTAPKVATEAAARPGNAGTRMAAVSPVPPVTSGAAAQSASMVAFYVSRGDQMLAIKDVSAARRFYEYGADLGNARAAADLASTYDPLFLSRLGVAGLQPDRTRAEIWYRKAAALGDADSQARLLTLNKDVSR